jgi:hypothetical protein
MCRPVWASRRASGKARNISVGSTVCVVSSYRRSYRGGKIPSMPIYRIAQDLSSRLGIARGMIRPPDYLDQLEDLALDHFPSRRAFLQS